MEYIHHTPLTMVCNDETPREHETLSLTFSIRETSISNRYVVSVVVLVSTTFLDSFSFHKPMSSGVRLYWILCVDSPFSVSTHSCVWSSEKEKRMAPGEWISTGFHLHHQNRTQKKRRREKQGLCLFFVIIFFLPFLFVTKEEKDKCVVRIIYIICYNIIMFSVCCTKIRSCRHNRYRRTVKAS